MNKSRWNDDFKSDHFAQEWDKLTLCASWYESTEEEESLVLSFNVSASLKFF